MKVHIQHEGKVFVRDVALADSFWLRLSGYMFRTRPHVNGLLFEPASAMQTTFMFFSLDMVFLTENDQVIKVLRNVKPWRHTWFYWKTRKVLEVPAGVVLTSLKVGDRLVITPEA